MLTHRFMAYLVDETEDRWADIELNPEIFGPQVAAETLWRDGLSDEDIAAYEKDLGFTFPDDVKTFLSLVNGWDKNQILTHGPEVKGEVTGVYAYPDDLVEVKDRIAELKKDLDSAFEPLGYDKALWKDVHFLPIFAHRYVVCTPDPEVSAVISYHPGDTILYGDSLQDYLYTEFLKDLWE